MPKVLPEYKEKATERILSAASQVFSEKGYYETRMEDIAERLGVSKRTLYLYFKSKEDLFKAMCAEAPQAIREMLQAPEFQLAMKEGGFGHACKVFFDISTRGHISGLSYDLIAAAARDAELQKIVHELYENQIAVIADFLEDMKKAGDLPRNANTRHP